MRTITILVVEDEASHAAALRRIRELWRAEDGTDGAAEREALITLVCAYEEASDPWPDLTPAEIVKDVMESNGLTQKDLAPIFGSQGRVSEFLSGKRPLGRDQAVRLNRAYNIPLSLLLGVEPSR